MLLRPAQGRPSRPGLASPSGSNRYSAEQAVGFAQECQRQKFLSANSMCFSELHLVRRFTDDPPKTIYPGKDIFVITPTALCPGTVQVFPN